ncbi:MAG: flagellar basal body L-ring protein FlgH [Pseudomonadota bacterium]
MRLIRIVAVALGVQLVCACSTFSEAIEPLEPMPIPTLPTAKPTSGSLYTGSASLNLFDDVRAKNVGDMLTVLLVERMDATKSASTSTTKDSEVTVNPGTIAGYPVTRNGVPLLSNALGSSNTFDGSGQATQSNALEGSLAVVVVERYANGYLRVQGRKRIKLNQGIESVVVTGIVRPQDITSTNTINSDRIADASIAYGGRGALEDANRMGFLQRFFNSPWSFTH